MSKPIRKLPETPAEAKGMRILDGISTDLPALVRARKIKQRCSDEGWEWQNPRQQLDKVVEEVEEIQEALDDNHGPDAVEHEIGDLLFIIADFARMNGIDAETALHKASTRLESRFRYMEAELNRQGKTVSSATPEERMAIWQEAKRVEKEASA